MTADPTLVSALSPAEFVARLKGPGLGVRIGPFDVHIRVSVAGLFEPLHSLYSGYQVLDDNRVFSCHVWLCEVPDLRSRMHRKVRFLVDGRAPHEDMPAHHGLAVLEWGINLVIALRFHCFLMLHSAVLERNGRALLMPAAPGSGKTTLCAALAHRGWRLLSDEFGLIRPVSMDLLPIPRPMPLKNGSIAVIRSFAPDAVMGPQIVGTRKGTVAHVRPPDASFARAGEVARARWIVFPRWVAGESLSLKALSQADGFKSLSTNAFNYDKHGEAGFETIRELVDGSQCFQLVYSDLGQAVEMLTQLADDDS